MKKICSEGSHALVQNWFCLPLVYAALSCLSDSPAPQFCRLSVQRPERFLLRLVPRSPRPLPQPCISSQEGKGIIYRTKGSTRTILHGCEPIVD